MHVLTHLFRSRIVSHMCLIVWALPRSPKIVPIPLGCGGMGEVYRARDTRLGRTVALKVLRTGLADRPDFRRRFEREARAISALNHPHVCNLYDIGEQDGIAYLAMEYVEGETMAAG